MLAARHLGSRVSELLDGRLTPAQEQQARAHLDRCRRCTEALEAERQVRAVLRGAVEPGVNPPPELSAGLLGLAATAPPPRGRRPRRGARAGLLAVGAVVTLGVAGVATPVAGTVGPAFTALLGEPSPARTARIAVIPAGPGAGAHTNIRFESSYQPSPAPSSAPAR